MVRVEEARRGGYPVRGLWETMNIPLFILKKDLEESESITIFLGDEADNVFHISVNEHQNDHLSYQ